MLGVGERLVEMLAGTERLNQVALTCCHAIETVGRTERKRRLQ